MAAIDHLNLCMEESEDMKELQERIEFLTSEVKLNKNKLRLLIKAFKIM